MDTAIKNDTFSRCDPYPLSELLACLSWIFRVCAVCTLCVRCCVYAVCVRCCVYAVCTLCVYAAVCTLCVHKHG